MNREANNTLWIVSIAALALSVVTGWKVLTQTDAKPKDAAAASSAEGSTPKQVSKSTKEQTERDAVAPASPTNSSSSTSSSSSLPSPSSSVAASSSPPLAPTKSVPKTEAAQAPVDLKLSSTVRLPLVPIATDKNKLEEEAFSVANTLAGKRPSDAKAVHVAAVCNSQLNKTGEAQRLWLKCVELEPKVETYYLNLAANGLFRGDTEFALSILEKAEANGISSSDISHHKGLALSRLGEDERAVEVLQKAIDSGASSPAHWMILGQSQMRLGKLDDAKRNMERAVELGVNNRALYSALMNTCVRLKLPEQAAKYREIVESMGDDTTTDGQQRFEMISDREARRVLISVLAEASSVYRGVGMFEDAELLALRLLAIDPGNYGMCRFLADLYHDGKRIPEEITVRERMLEIAPNDLMNYLQLAKNYADASQPKQTEALLKMAIAIAPNQAIGYAAMAEFLLERRNPTQAKWYAEQALNREPSPAGYKLLASIHRMLGQESEAQKVEAAARETAKAPASTPAETRPATSPNTAVTETPQ